MREEKGITLISLITYIIVLLIVISVVTVVGNFLASNMNEMQSDLSNISEINKFDYVFLKDIKQEGVSIDSVKNNTTIILLYEDGKDVQYIYSKDSIYRVETTSKNKEKRLVCSKVTRI